MACFHFDTQTGETITRDEEGYDLPDLGSACQEARASAREILIEAIRTSGSVPDKFLITDCDRNVQAIVHFSEALPPSMRR